MAKRNSYAFTLLELLLVMLLISLSLSAIGIYIPKALKKEAFEKGVDHVIAKISLAEQLMLDYQISTIFLLKRTNDGIESEIIPMQSIPLRLKAAVNRHSKIKGIEDFSFNGKHVDNLFLQFEPNVAGLQRGTLKLISKQNEVSIYLKEFPSKIQRGAFQEHEITAIYPEEILSSL